MAEIPKITIFSTHTCPFCKMEKALLDGRGVAFTEYFVDEDDQARERMIAMTQQRGVPVTMLEYSDGAKTCFIGFQQELVEAVLRGEKVGQPCVS